MSHLEIRESVQRGRERMSQLVSPEHCILHSVRHLGDLNRVKRVANLLRNEFRRLAR